MEALLRGAAVDRDGRGCHSVEDLTEKVAELLRHAATATGARHVATSLELSADVVLYLGGENGVHGNTASVLVREAVRRQPGSDSRPARQNDVAAALLLALRQADGSVWVEQQLPVRHPQGWSFSYACQASLACWHQQQKSKARSGGDSDAIRLSRPAFDCRGAVKISFSQSADSVIINYEHTLYHQTVGQLASLVPPPRPPSPLPTHVPAPGSAAKRQRATDPATTPKRKRRRATAAEVAGKVSGEAGEVSGEAAEVAGEASGEAAGEAAGGLSREAAGGLSREAAGEASREAAAEASGAGAAEGTALATDASSVSQTAEPKGSAALAKPKRTRRPRPKAAKKAGGQEPAAPRAGEGAAAGADSGNNSANHVVDAGIDVGADNVSTASADMDYRQMAEALLQGIQDDNDGPAETVTSASALMDTWQSSRDHEGQQTQTQLPPLHPHPPQVAPLHPHPQLPPLHPHPPQVAPLHPLPQLPPLHPHPPQLPPLHPHPQLPLHPHPPQTAPTASIESSDNSARPPAPPALPASLPPYKTVTEAEVSAVRQATALSLLSQSKIDAATLSKEQFCTFANQAPALQTESLILLVQYGADRLAIVPPQNRSSTGTQSPGPSAEPAQAPPPSSWQAQPQPSSWQAQPAPPTQTEAQAPTAPTPAKSTPKPAWSSQRPDTAATVPCPMTSTAAATAAPDSAPAAVLTAEALNLPSAFKQRKRAPAKKATTADTLPKHRENHASARRPRRRQSQFQDQQLLRLQLPSPFLRQPPPQHPDR